VSKRHDLILARLVLVVLVLLFVSGTVAITLGWGTQTARLGGFLLVASLWMAMIFFVYVKMRLKGTDLIHYQQEQASKVTSK